MIRAVFIRRVASVGLSFSHLELRDFAKYLSEAPGPDATRSLFSINGYRNGRTMRKEAPFPAPSLSAQMRPSVQLHQFPALRQSQPGAGIPERLLLRLPHR